MKRAMLGALAASILGGCVTTAKYDESNLKELSEAKVSQIARELDQEGVNGSTYVPKVDAHALPYHEAQGLAQNYMGLPQIKTNVYIGDLESRVLDTTGYLNGSMDELKDIGAKIPSDYENRTQLVIGNPDDYLVSGRSKDNQLTRKSGLLGITSLNPREQGSGVTVSVINTTGVRNWNNSSDYQIRVTFGSPEVAQEQIRKDFGYLATTAEDATALGLLFGPKAAAGSVAYAGLEGAWAFFESLDNAPDETTLTRTNAKNGSIGLVDRGIAETFNIVRMVQRTRAPTTILGRNPGQIVYADITGEPEIGEDYIAFNASREDANHVLGFFHRMLGVAANVGVYSEGKDKTRTETKVVPGPGPNPSGVQGGRSGGVGGTNNPNGVSGSGPRGVGGN